MKKTLLGIDIGHKQLKMVLTDGTRIVKTAVATMPQSMVKEGRVVSSEAMAEFIRNIMSENGISCRHAALVIPDESVIIRNMTLPLMTDAQIKINLPYEFRDYITEELNRYEFDYAVITTEEELKAQNRENGESYTMDLIAVAVQKEILEEAKDMIRKAGLKLTKIVPAACTYGVLLSNTTSDGESEENNYDYAILDLGQKTIRLHIFRNGHLEISRLMDMGLDAIVTIIANKYNVDDYLAHTYMINNFENCLSDDACKNAFSEMGVEVMRALNFHSFNNPDRQLKKVWICGGGSKISYLKDELSAVLDLEIEELVDLIDSDDDNLKDIIQAYGVTQ